jgi:hypothetical protein
MSDAVLCSACFRDQGLRLDSLRHGTKDDSPCIHCGSTEGSKLTRNLVGQIAHRFFVRGTTQRLDFGAAPVVVMNEHQQTTITAAPWFEPDIRLLEKTLDVGFFHYGPRMWMVGEVEPLKALQRPDERRKILERITREYSARILSKTDIFYRLRRSPHDPSSPSEYDSPPGHLLGEGRLDSAEFPVLYGSQDLQVCVHECRVTVDDESFIASLIPTRDLRLLDLTHLLQEEGVAEFESLDLTVHMLFLAGKHAYEIARAVATAARDAEFDGLIYPSYFSLLRTGAAPFATIYGISIRKFPGLAQRAQEQTIPNFAIFGRPIREGSVAVHCINRLILNQADYDLVFGPVGYE